MIKIAGINRVSGKFRLLTIEDLETWSKDSPELIWIDFESHAKDKERKILEKTFEINSLAIEDAQKDRHPPKLEWFDGYFFLLMKAFTASSNQNEFDILHISFFVGKNFLITRHDGESPSINKVWAAIESGGLEKGRGTYFISYKIIRIIIDRYTPIIYKMETQLEVMEEQMLQDPSDTILAQLIKYNGDLKKLRRIFNYESNVLETLSSSKLITSHPERIHEFQVIHEQIERLASLSSLLQELTKDLIDGYISVTSHRLNKIMKVLTIVTVFFLPLTFMAGIYGMNFEHMPELKIENAYYALLSIMAVSVIVLLLLFKKIKWI